MSDPQTQFSIPPKERKEWAELVNGNINHQFQNFVLQMKTAEFSRKISNGQISTEAAVDELYELCRKYAVAVQSDFKTIFKEW
ncbi:MAG: hypothetical protein ACFB10_06885 [Salibacteraceae bacterium]